MNRADYIKYCEELRTEDTETFGTGARLSRRLGLSKIGTNYEVLRLGDCVGLKPGTGHAHTLINNSDQVVKAIVVGETDVPNDKIFYPMHPDRNEECKEKGFFWDGHSVHDLGNHDGWSDKKRPKRN